MGLCRDTIQATVVSRLNDAVARLIAALDENICRKEMTLEEKTLLAVKIERLEKPKAEKRKAEGQKTVVLVPSRFSTSRLSVLNLAIAVSWANNWRTCVSVLGSEFSPPKFAAIADWTR